MKDGWEVKPLGLLSEINYGYTESASLDAVGPRFLRITDIQNDRVDWNSVPYCPIDVTTIPKYRLATGDIVFARTGATTGKSFLVSNPPTAVFASYLIRLRITDKSLLPEFLSLFFQTDVYWKSIKDGSTGSAQGGFNASKLAALCVPVPPLVEQRRIVAILEESFEGIDTAVANAEKNLASARELFEIYLNAVFRQESGGSKERALGEIGGDVYTGPFGSLLHKSDYITGGVPLVNPAHIINGKIVPDREKTVDASAIERLKNYCLRKGDVIIGRRGEIGRCAVITDAEAGWLCGTGCFYIRVFKGTNPFFLAYLLRSKTYRERLEALSTGATMLNLSNTSLGALPICLPDLKDQESILLNIENLSSLVQSLKFIYKRKLGTLAELKQALLKKAFAGELTSQSANAVKEAAE